MSNCDLTAQARLSLHLSKCQIVGNHMSRLNCILALMCVPLFVCVLMFPPHGAMGWSEICDCSISWPYSLDFLALSQL